MPEQRISFEELEDLLRDIDTPETQLRQYFTGDKAQSRPFAPVLQANPATVELTARDEFRIQGAFAMNWANGVARWRRQRRFERRLARGDSVPVIVAEGDSWFQFPILLEDVIDQLDPSYLVWCVSAAGDTLENMIEVAPEYLKAIDQHRDRAEAFIFSGAGNDIVGEGSDGIPVIQKVVRDFEAGRPAAWYLQTDAFSERLAFVEKAYRTVFDTVGREFPGLPVIVHGYDRAIPWAGAGDGRAPIWAARDAWLAGPLGGKGITDPQLQRDIVAVMIDRLNTVQQRLCGGSQPGGAFANAYHADVRGTLTATTDWADELHPTDDGFKRVAPIFIDRLKAAIADR